MLFGIKEIAIMITGLPEWNPPLYDEATATGKHWRCGLKTQSNDSLGVKSGNEHEKFSILGMVMRLGIFARDWVRCPY
jgi:hypothetical protein